MQQPLTAAHRSAHFKDLRCRCSHDCVHDWLYTDARLSDRTAAATNHVLHELSGEYRLIMVGDAAMANSELSARYGIIRWAEVNEDPGIEWLRRLRGHFDHSVWLNTIPADEWDRAHGSTTIRLVREVFPMFELTVDGLTAAIKKLMVPH